MEPVVRNIENVDWITVLLVISLAFLVVAKSFFYTRFLNFLILPFNNKYVFMYNKKEKFNNIFHISLTLFQFVNFSLFAYYALNILIGSDSAKASSAYVFILSAFLLFFLIKGILQMGNGLVFNSHRIIGEIIFKKMSYLNHSALVMFVANLLLTYVFKDNEILVYVTFFLVFVINAIGWTTILRHHQKIVLNNFFYFILYLCALEIAPFIIVAGFLKLEAI
ncbi:MAG: DUF4271 domain-containing protein [Flavobacteriaceae bacterium]